MRLRKYIAFAGMAVLMLCSCNEMENAPTNKFTDNFIGLPPPKPSMW